MWYGLGGYKDESGLPWLFHHPLSTHTISAPCSCLNSFSHYDAFINSLTFWFCYALSLPGSLLCSVLSARYRNPWFFKMFILFVWGTNKTKGRLFITPYTHNSKHWIGVGLRRQKFNPSVPNGQQELHFLRHCHCLPRSPLVQRSAFWEPRIKFRNSSVGIDVC